MSKHRHGNGYRPEKVVHVGRLHLTLEESRALREQLLEAELAFLMDAPKDRGMRPDRIEKS